MVLTSLNSDKTMMFDMMKAVRLRSRWLRAYVSSPRRPSTVPCLLNREYDDMTRVGSGTQLSYFGVPIAIFIKIMHQLSLMMYVTLLHPGECSDCIHLMTFDFLFACMKCHKTDPIEKEVKRREPIGTNIAGYDEN